MSENQLYSIEKKTNTEEYHIFRSKWVKNDKGETICHLESKSICGKMNYDQNAQSMSICKDDDITRRKAAEIGRQVCGTCVSDLYETY